MSKNISIPYQRILGFDLLRTVSFIAIAFHHFTSDLWYTHEFSPFANQVWYWKVIDVFARSLTISGQSILLMTSFLISFTSIKHEKALKLIPLLLLVWVLSSLSDFGEAPFLFTWDIFPLIALGLSLVWIFFEYLPKLAQGISLFGLLLLFLPYEQIEFLKELPLFYKHILVGDCAKDIADWPIFPWVGLIFFGYGLGGYAQKNASKLKQWNHREKIIWILLLFWNPFYWKPFFQIEFGDQFSCAINLHQPLLFIAHTLPFLFLMRLSLLEPVQNTLIQNAVVLKISKLQINQKFGVAYIVHLMVISLFTENFGSILFSNPWAAMISMLAVLPITELVLRFIVFLRQKFPKDRTLDNKKENEG